jgi:hypothetical protein
LPVASDALVHDVATTPVASDENPVAADVVDA